MADAVFEDPRLAGLYDSLDSDRSDLQAYLGIAEELDAGSVLDVGCGTGTFACLLAGTGRSVTAVDPAAASLAVARHKEHSGSVRWLQGIAAALPQMEVELVTMTGNVAQVFISDGDWAGNLRGIRAALPPGGHLAFETRVPEQRAWEEWNPRESLQRVAAPGGERVRAWTEVTSLRPQLVTFRWTFVFEDRGEVITSTTTLRFRSREQVVQELEREGFEVLEVREAPDRPGRELVFLARRRARPAPPRPA